jgi:hypothetical protein
MIERRTSSSPPEPHGQRSEPDPTTSLVVAAEPAILHTPALARVRPSVRTGYYSEDIGEGCINDSGIDL